MQLRRGTDVDWGADGYGDAGVGAGQASGAPVSKEEDSSGSWSSALGGLFGQKSERQKGRVEEQVDEAVDETTDKAVDKVLDKAFGKIFGR